MIFCIEDGGSMDLRNGGILPHQYTASQPRGPIYERSEDIWEQGSEENLNPQTEEVKSG
jgi:hypothetical protein